jgi:hypothetical protein
MKVRFRKEYAETTNGRLSYELVSDELVVDRFVRYYNTKFLGFIPAYKMEPSEDTDTPAIEIFIKLSTM